MSDSIMRGAYSDFKVIKSRKVIQMVVEFPIESSNSFVEMFGIPQPHEEQWVAVALMDKRAVIRNETATIAIRDAGILCKNPSFGEWLRAERGMSEVDPNDSDSIAQAVRAILGIRSRSELSDNSEALQ
ncbi:MAG: hypothetical protein VX978_06320, partial [Pseudomonadota bacterium]|nr:hypothetical protein [Pseudomonadota bacterium]